MNISHWINKNNFSYRVIQILIFLAHFVLLWWMFYVLQEGGLLTTTQLIGHFAGMSLLGAFLIRFTSWITMRQHLKEMKSE